MNVVARSKADVKRQAASGPSPLLLLGLAAACLACTSGGLQAAVLVLANRTPEPVRVTVGTRATWLASYRLRPTESLAIYVPMNELRVQVHDAVPSGDSVFDCVPNAAYFVYRDPERNTLELAAIGLVRQPRPFYELQHLLQPLVALPQPSLPVRPPLKLRLKLAVDDEERATTAAWQRRLRERVRRASAALARQLRVVLEIEEMTIWESDDRTEDFEFALAEFSWEVPAAPADLAIGFSSQFAGMPPESGHHLGVSHGPLQQHILIREGVPGMTEMDYVEVLVHELGHFLGAAHSPEPDSAMRPLLGDNKAVVRSFIIQFDPLNCLAAATVAEQLRLGPLTARNLGALSPQRRHLLSRIYATLLKVLPDDETADRYLTMVAPEVTTEPTGFAARVRRVLRAVVEEASIVGGLASDGSTDTLTERYVRAAARAALEFEEDDRGKAFLIGLAIALDREGVFARTPLLSTIYKAVETDRERRERLRLLGNPTVHERADLLAHFTVSAALTALVGKTLAWEAGLMKEFNDANGGSGFSFADLGANLAGIKFASQALNSQEFLQQVAQSFRVRDYIPAPDGLPEGLSMELFRERYGGRQDERFKSAVEAVQALVEQLPGY